MTIGSTSQLSAALAQILQGRTPASLTTSAGALEAPRGSSSGNGLASTVLQALSQIGVTGSQTAGASGSTSASPALQSFLQSLLAALQAQGTPSTQGAKPGTATSTLGGSHGHAHHGRGRLEQNLKSLIGQLQSANGTLASTGTSGTSPLASLKTSFGQLVSAYGGASGNSASLGAFLNVLATDLAAPSAGGQLVSVEA